jgi:hypothetical protein
VFEGLLENLRFQRVLAQEPMKFANLVLQMLAAVRLPWATSDAR